MSFIFWVLVVFNVLALFGHLVLPVGYKLNEVSVSGKFIGMVQVALHLVFLIHIYNLGILG